MSKELPYEVGKEISDFIDTSESIEELEELREILEEANEDGGFQKTK